MRNRENIDELKAQMKRMGADEVLTEEEARRAWRELPRPRLALNCVGGASGTELCKALGEDGVHVTYGGMSLKPVIAATSHMIFKVNLRYYFLLRDCRHKFSWVILFTKVPIVSLPEHSVSRN